MKKYLLILLTAMTFIACNMRKNDKMADDSLKQGVEAQDTTMVQLIDSVYNFGKVNEGEKVAYDFRFKNTGTKPLVIASTFASCGCTVPEKPEKPILPGETGVIKVVFNSKGKIGHNEKTITVVANTNPVFPMLRLSGDVTEVK